MPLTRGIWLSLLMVGLALNACTLLPKGEGTFDVGVEQLGIASWYGEDFHGWLTANGEIYDMQGMTGAHRTLPLGSEVLVTNVENGLQVRVRINDRGPYKRGRVLDLSFGAARRLGMVDHGTSAVHLEVVGGLEMDLLLAPEGSSGMIQLPAPLNVSPAGASEGVSSRHSDVVLSQSSSQPGAFRMLPSDFMRERRARRVGDILEAEQSVYGVAELVLD
ncbi:MAG: septal ring lytic transglycosylase RlpA family protein [Nitrospiraceae bacterium]